MANFLTAIRLLLAVPFAYCMAQGGRGTAAVGLALFVIALATDFADGPMARKRGTVTPLSGTFDHTTDFLFVTAGTFAGAWRGVFPWIYPALIVAAFLQYFIGSYFFPQGLKPLRGAAEMSELKLRLPEEQNKAEVQGAAVSAPASVGMAAAVPPSKRRGLRASWLGRWNGILYFAPPCTDCVIRLGAWFLAWPLRIFVWGLVISTLISMGNRLAFRE